MNNWRGAYYLLVSIACVLFSSTPARCEERRFYSDLQLHVNGPDSEALGQTPRDNGKIKIPERGHWDVYPFAHFTDQDVGRLAAEVRKWCIPAIGLDTGLGFSEKSLRQLNGLYCLKKLTITTGWPEFPLPVPPLEKESALDYLDDLSQLRVLSWVDKRKIPERVLENLRKFPKLEELSIDNPGLTDAALCSFNKFLPQLRMLMMSMHDIKGPGLKCLRRITTLREFDATRWGGIFDDDKIQYLPMGLEVLDLAREPITDQGLASLKRLTHLKELNIIGSNITDKGLMSLADCKELEELYLFDTRVTAAGILALKGLPRLKKVRTDVEVPPELQKEFPGTEFEQQINTEDEGH